MTEEFEDLKKGQGELTQRLDGVLIWYYALVKQEAETKAAAKASAAAALAAASAKTETSGEKPAEEGGEVEIRQSVSVSQYCETRADVIDAIQEWTTIASC